MCCKNETLNFYIISKVSPSDKKDNICYVYIGKRQTRRYVLTALIRPYNRRLRLLAGTGIERHGLTNFNLGSAKAGGRGDGGQSLL